MSERQSRNSEETVSRLPVVLALVVFVAILLVLGLAGGMFNG